MDTPLRAKSIAQAEYAVLETIIQTVDLEWLRAAMVNDAVSAERFDKGATNILQMLDRMLEPRKKHATRALTRFCSLED